jgi:hypothetical protein
MNKIGFKTRESYHGPGLIIEDHFILSGADSYSIEKFDYARNELSTVIQDVTTAKHRKKGACFKLRDFCRGAGVDKWCSKNCILQ